MLGLGFGEIFVIVFVAVLSLGPDRFPSAVVQVARFMKTVRSTVNNVKDTISRELGVGSGAGRASFRDQSIDSEVRSHSFGNGFDVRIDSSVDAYPAVYSGGIGDLFSGYGPKSVGVRKNDKPDGLSIELPDMCDDTGCRVLDSFASVNSCNEDPFVNVPSPVEGESSSNIEITTRNRAHD